MRRVDLFLFALLVLCAIMVVHTQHRARRLFVDLQRERGAGEQLASDLRRLQAEQATLAAANRVERAAGDMHMHLPEPGRSYALAGPLPALAGVVPAPPGAARLAANTAAPLAAAGARR